MSVKGSVLGLLAAGMLAACSGEAGQGAQAGGEPTGIEAACRDDLLTKVPNPQAARIEAFTPVEWREYAAGLKSAAFDRLAGEKLGRIEQVADQALKGGESATDKTWRIKLKARSIKGDETTVPAWCRSLKSDPEGCACETPLKTE